MFAKRLPVRSAENNRCTKFPFSLQHVSCVAALVRNPGMLASMARTFVDTPMRARPAVFVAANALGLGAGEVSFFSERFPRFPNGSRIASGPLVS